MTHDIWLIARVQWRLARAPAETAGPALCLCHPEDQLKASGLLVFGSLRDQFVFMLFTPPVLHLVYQRRQHHKASPGDLIHGLSGKHREKVEYLRDSDGGSFYVPVIVWCTCCYYELAVPRLSSGCWKIPRRD